MKKLALVTLLTLLFCTFSLSQDNPVILTIDGKEIRKDEFLFSYTKNNNNVKYDKETLDKYVEMYIKFKMKVAEAEELGYDTIQRLKNELNGYKKKSAEKYLTDSEATETLKKEAYERKKTEVKASHILFMGSDAYKKALEVRKEILKSGDFEAAAIKYSQDPSVSENKGSLGYFSVFQMVYPFEEAAYNLKVGEISMPVKTQFGYHLVKVYDKRANPGKVKVAHIYSKIPKEATEKQQADARIKIDEIYQLIKNGKSTFEELAKQYSDDNTSAQKGGELPWFTSGRMVPEFENVAYELKTKGDISEPFLTSYGWHIVKKLDQEPIGSYDQLKAEIEGNIKRGDRSKKSQEYFVEKLKDSLKFRDKSKSWIKNSYSEEAEGNLNVNDNKTAFKLKKQKGWFKKKTKVSVKEFKDYLKTRKPHSQQDVELFYKDFVTKYMMDYEKSMLYTNYPEYKALMQEFKDGILLFEISDQKVWKKSSEDTTGLKQFFETNKSNYTWNKRYDVEIYTSSKKEAIFKAISLARDSGKSAQEILTIVNKESQLNLSIQKGKYELENKTILKKFPEKVGVSDPIIEDGQFVFIRVIEVLPPQPKKLNETRGAAISDYQKYLEEEWIKSLKQKYKVEINEEALYSLNN